MTDETGKAARTGRQGGKTRLAVQTWIGVYPVLTVIAMVLEPLIHDMGVPVRTLIMSVLMVPIMVFGVMPMISGFERRH